MCLIIVKKNKNFEKYHLFLVILIFKMYIYAVKMKIITEMT